MKQLTESDIAALVKRQAGISLVARAHALLREAEARGFVLTIEAGGVVTVRPSRATYAVAQS